MNKKIRIFFSRLVIAVQLIQLMSPAIVLAADNMCNVNPGSCTTQQDWEKGWGDARQQENAGAVAKQDEWTNANDSAPEIIRESGESNDVNRSQKAADAGHAPPVNAAVSEREDKYKKEQKIELRQENAVTRAEERQQRQEERRQDKVAPAPAAAPVPVPAAEKPSDIFCNYCGGFWADSKGAGCRDQAIGKCPDESGLKPAVVGAGCFNANNTPCGKNGYGTVDIDDNGDDVADRTEVLTSTAAGPPGQECAGGKKPIAGRCFNELPQEPEPVVEAPAAALGSALTAAEMRLEAEELQFIHEAQQADRAAFISKEGLEAKERQEGAAKVDAKLMPPTAAKQLEICRPGIGRNPDGSCAETFKQETETVRVGGGKFGQEMTVTTTSYCSGDSAVTQSRRSDGVVSSSSTGCEWGCSAGACRNATPEEAQVYRYSVLQNAIEREVIVCRNTAGDARDATGCTEAAAYDKAINNLKPEELSPTIKQAFNDSSWVPDDVRQELVSQRIEEIRRAEKAKPVYVPRLTEAEIKAKAEQFVQETMDAGRLRPGSDDTLSSDSPEYQALVQYAKQNPFLTGLSINKEFTANLFAAGMSGLVTGGEVMGNKLGDQFSPYYQARQVKEEVLGSCGLKGWETRLTAEQGACLRGESLVVKVNNAGLQHEREVNAALQVGTGILATMTGGAGGALAKGAPKLIGFAAEVLPQVGVDMAAAPVFADLYSREARNRAAIYEALASSGGGDQTERAVWSEQAQRSAEQADEQYRQELVNGFVTAVVANLGFEAVGRALPKVFGDSAVGKVLFGSSREAEVAAKTVVDGFNAAILTSDGTRLVAGEEVFQPEAILGRGGAVEYQVPEGAMYKGEMTNSAKAILENPLQGMVVRVSDGDIFVAVGDGTYRKFTAVGGELPASVKPVAGRVVTADDVMATRNTLAEANTGRLADEPMVAVGGNSGRLLPAGQEVAEVIGAIPAGPLTTGNLFDRAGQTVGDVVDNVGEALPFGRKPVDLEGPPVSAAKSTSEAFLESGSVEVVPKGGGEPYRVDYDPNNPSKLDSLKPGDTVDDIHGQGWIKNESGWSSLGEEVGGGGGSEESIPGLGEIKPGKLDVVLSSKSPVRVPGTVGTEVSLSGKTAIVIARDRADSVVLNGRLISRPTTLHEGDEVVINGVLAVVEMTPDGPRIISAGEIAPLSEPAEVFRPIPKPDFDAERSLSGAPNNLRDLDKVESQRVLDRTRVETKNPDRRIVHDADKELREIFGKKGWTPTTKDDLVNNGLAPKYRAMIDGVTASGEPTKTTFYLSDVFQSPDGRLFAIGYSGEPPTPKVYYRSKSHGNWRVTPDAKYSVAEGKLIYGKGSIDQLGVNEEFAMSLTTELQETLTNLSQKPKKVKDAQKIVFGLLEIKDADAATSKLVDKGINIEQLFATDPKTGKRVYKDTGYAPDFNRPVHQYGAKACPPGLECQGTAVVFASKDNQLLYTYFYDPKTGRVWSLSVSSSNAPVNELGTRSLYFDSGDYFIDSPYEYRDLVEQNYNMKQYAKPVPKQNQYYDVYGYIEQKPHIQEAKTAIQRAVGGTTSAGGTGGLGGFLQKVKGALSGGVSKGEVVSVPYPTKVSQLAGNESIVKVFSDRWPQVTRDLEAELRRGVTMKEAVDTVMNRLKSGGSYSINLNDRQVDHYFRPDVEDAAKSIDEQLRGGRRSFSGLGIVAPGGKLIDDFIGGIKARFGRGSSLDDLVGPAGGVYYEKPLRGVTVGDSLRNSVNQTAGRSGRDRAVNFLAEHPVRMTIDEAGNFMPQTGGDAELLRLASQNGLSSNEVPVLYPGWTKTNLSDALAIAVRQEAEGIPIPQSNHAFLASPRFTDELNLQTYVLSTQTTVTSIDVVVDNQGRIIAAGNIQDLSESIRQGLESGEYHRLGLTVSEPGYINHNNISGLDNLDEAARANVVDGISQYNHGLQDLREQGLPEELVNPARPKGEADREGGGLKPAPTMALPEEVGAGGRDWGAGNGVIDVAKIASFDPVQVTANTIREMYTSFSQMLEGLGSSSRVYPIRETELFPGVESQLLSLKIQAATPVQHQIIDTTIAEFPSTLKKAQEYFPDNPHLATLGLEDKLRPLLKEDPAFYYGTIDALKVDISAAKTYIDVNYAAVLSDVPGSLKEVKLFHVTDREFDEYRHYLRFDEAKLPKNATVVEIGSGASQKFSQGISQSRPDVKVAELDASLALPLNDKFYDDLAQSEERIIYNIQKEDGREVIGSTFETRQKRRGVQQGTFAAIAPELPISSLSTDSVVDMFGPGYYLPKELRVEYFSEINRILKPGGEATLFPIDTGEEAARTFALKTIDQDEYFRRVEERTRFELLGAGIDPDQFSFYRQEDQTGNIRVGVKINKPGGINGIIEGIVEAVKESVGIDQLGRKSKDVKLNFAPDGEKEISAAGGGSRLGRFGDESEDQSRDSNDCSHQIELVNCQQSVHRVGEASLAQRKLAHHSTRASINPQYTPELSILSNPWNIGIANVAKNSNPRLLNNSESLSNWDGIRKAREGIIGEFSIGLNQLSMLAPQVYAADIGGEKIIPLSMYRALAGQVLFRKAVEGLAENERTAEKIGEAVLGAAAVANAIPERGVLSSNKAGYWAVSGTEGIAAGAVGKGIYRVSAEAVAGVDLILPEKVNVGVNGDGAVLVGVAEGKGRVKVVGELEWYQRLLLPVGEWIERRLAPPARAAEAEEGLEGTEGQEGRNAGRVPVTVQLFIDENKNGKMDIGEEPAKLAGVKVNLVSETKTVSYNLTEGWNFVAFPLIPESVKTAAELVQDVALDGGYVTTVATWKQDKWMEFSQRGGQKFGQDFELQPGRAYFLNSHSESTWTLAGTPLPEENRALQLRKGWNGVGIPERGTTAVQVMDEIQRTENREQRTVSGEVADQVGRWDFGLWEVVVKRRYSPEHHEIYGRDFPIKPEEGYFVHANEDVRFQ